MSPGTLSLVPGYRVTPLGMTFDIGADNQSKVLALHSPLLDRCVKQVGLGMRTAPSTEEGSGRSELARQLQSAGGSFHTPSGGGV